MNRASTNTTPVVKRSSSAFFPVLLAAAALALLTLGTGCKNNSSSSSSGGSSAGSIDSSFGGGDGISTSALGSSSDEAFNGVTTDSSDRIIAVGWTDQTTRDILVIRYDSDGSLDTTFGSSGIAMFDITGTADEANDVAIDSSGRIVIVGKTNNGTDDDWLIMRLTSAGALDTTFDGDGIQTIDFSNDNDSATGLAILSSGDIAVTGIGKITTDDFAAALLNDDGSLDTNFDTDGKATYDVASGDADQAFDVVTSGTDLILGGFSNSGGGGNNFALLRIDSTGARVTGFGSNGQVVTDFNGDTDEGYAIAMNSGGTRIYLVGSITNSGRTLMGAIAYLESDGSLDTTFDTDGKVEVDFGAATDNHKAAGVAVQSDGKVVLAGSVEVTAGDYDVAIARLSTGGALDTSFDSDGMQTFDINGTESDIGHAVAPHQSKFVVVGETNVASPANIDEFVLRFND